MRKNVHAQESSAVGSASQRKVDMSHESELQAIYGALNAKNVDEIANTLTEGAIFHILSDPVLPATTDWAEHAGLAPCPRVARALRRPSRGRCAMAALLVDGHCTTDDRLTGNDPDCGPAAGKRPRLTKFDLLARSLPEAGAIAVELTLRQLGLHLGGRHRACCLFVELVHQECIIEVR